jgi:hypothetical protein
MKERFVMSWSKSEIENQRDILYNWHNLTAGDISIIKLMLTPKYKDSALQTMSGTAHAKLWHSLVGLGWANELSPPQNFQEVLGEAALCFELSEIGHMEVPRFIEFRKLFQLSEYNHRIGRKLSEMSRYVPTPPQI